MCGRYAIYGPASLSRQARQAMDELGVDLIGAISQRDPQYNVAPTQRAPVIYRREDGLVVEAFKWGLVPILAKDVKIGNSAINARVETVQEKPMFRTAFKKRRCLVPMSGYFEWKGEQGHKQPFFIHDPEGHLIVAAGLWEVWKPKDDEAAAWLHTFTIVTGEPGKVSGDIHDRQPVFLSAERWPAWLDGSPAEAGDALAGVAEPPLTYYPVSKAVGSPHNKGAELVQAVDLG